MYYKVTNKESDVYKKLHAMRTEEIARHVRNLKALSEKIPYKWENFYGHQGQQTFTRGCEYVGFKFLDEVIDLKIWSKANNPKGYYLPNSRTKAGREMKSFLSHLEKGYFKDPLDILGCDDVRGKFTLPYVEIEGEVIVIYLDSKQFPTDENVIEITSKEFNEIQGV